MTLFGIHIFSTLFFVLTVSLSLLPNVAFGEVIRVGVGQSIVTIKQAINVSTPGDTILVDAGTYVESELEITHKLLLKGIDQPLIDGNGKGSIIKILADSVTVDGFHLDNVEFSHRKEYGAVQVLRSRHFLVQNNRMTNVFFGVLIEKSQDGKVMNNVVQGKFLAEFESGNGVHGWHSSHLEIKGNILSGLRDGIYLEFVDHSTIEENEAFDNIRYGLHFMFANHDSYSGNSFYRNGAGVAVMFSKFIRMERNRFFDNWGTASFGLLLKEIYDAEIIENSFSGNTIGINIEGSTRINYFKNHLVGNGWAVKVNGGCYANNFSQNSFIANSFDLSYNSKLNDNRFDGNYWSDYTGYDLNKDGIGDVPYRPVKLFSYIAHRTPESIVLLRSLFMDIINFSEKVSPVFTPDKLVDKSPLLASVSYDPSN